MKEDHLAKTIVQTAFDLHKGNIQELLNRLDAPSL
jgi:hypothetical protein